MDEIHKQLIAASLAAAALSASTEKFATADEAIDRVFELHQKIIDRLDSQNGKGVVPKPITIDL